jgi:hypothetical protein
VTQSSLKNLHFDLRTLRSEENKKPDEESGGGRKVPSGFEKLLKRSKKGS